MKPRIEKYVINRDAGGRHIVCGWDDCERDGYESNKLLLHDHPVDRGCQHADRVSLAHGNGTAHRWIVFCTERHRQYFDNAQGRAAHRSIESTGRAYGNLPVGSRGLIR